MYDVSCSVFQWWSGTIIIYSRLIFLYCNSSSNHTDKHITGVEQFFFHLSYSFVVVAYKSDRHILETYSLFVLSQTFFSHARAPNAVFVVCRQNYIGFGVRKTVWLLRSGDTKCSVTRAINSVWCPFFVLCKPLYMLIYYWHHVVVASQ